jgi:hypothetical protein
MKPTDDHTEVHVAFTEKMRQYFNMPEFIKLRQVAGRKQVQVVLLGNYLSAWEELAYNKFGKPHSFLEYRQLIAQTMKNWYLPQLEDYYGTAITHFYMLEPHVQGNSIYGFTIKLFDSPIFKMVDPQHALLEETLSNALSSRLRYQYGRGPGKVTAALIASRYLVFVAGEMLSPFLRSYIEDNPEASSVMEKMLEALMRDAVDFACEKHYGKTYETFVEIDLAGNQMIALAIINPLTSEDLKFD